MLNFINKNISRFDGHMQELLRGASIALILKLLAAVLAFGLNLVLARLLGAEDFGMFFLAVTIVLIVAVIGRVGMENALVRFIAVNVAATRPGKVLGVYSKAMLYSSVMSVILSVLLYILAPWVSQVVFNKPALLQPLSIMAFAVSPFVLLTLHAYALQGLKEIAASISVQSIFPQLLTCLIAIFFVPIYGINAAALGYLLSTIFALLLGRWFWKRAISSFESHVVEFDRKELLTSSMPLFAVTMMNIVIVWSPMLFLGIWESGENIGIYNAANRTAMLISFILVAVNSIAAPKFATLFQAGNLSSLENVAIGSTKIMILLACPLVLLFFLTPEWILSIFGEQFKQGATVLMILSIGQFVNIATGSVGYLLIMSNNELLMRRILLFCTLLAFLLNILLIPNYGITGAAIGASFVISTQKLIAMFFVWKRLDIMTFPRLNIFMIK